MDRKTLLVAYDLGLGKTVIALGGVERLMDMGEIREPGLVVCLSSLKYQWADSITKFTDSKPLVIDGSPKQRALQYEQALDWQNSGVDYVVLNYEQVVNDWSYVSKLAKGFVILDEATAIKSFRSKRSRQVKKLKSGVRIALTGTPMENGKPEEVYSIMQFVDPTVLGRFDTFDLKYIVRDGWGRVARYRNLSEFHEVMKTAMVRKRQADPDVAKFLPTTIAATPLRVPFNKALKPVYRRVVRDLLLDLEEMAQTAPQGSWSLQAHYGQGSVSAEVSEVRGKIMSKVTVLRMLCDDPRLVIESGEAFLAMTGSGSQYAAELLADMENLKVINPKVQTLVQYLKDHLDADPSHKVVVFTTFVKMVDIIAEEMHSYGAVAYTGRLNASQKEAEKQKFQTDPNVRVFVSSDAGGFGVDLPQANLLVNYDQPWSAGTAIQRRGRIKRVSSTWKTIVTQDIVMADSIEERVADLLEQKTKVQAAVIDGEEISAEADTMDLDLSTLTEFLKTSQV